MERAASASRDTLGKRPLEKRKSIGETLPAKLRPPKSPSSINPQETSYKEFVLGHEVNDVEEHFRRSLEQLNRKSVDAKDVHQIIVTENTPQHSSTPSPASQQVQYSPKVIARVPSNGTAVGVASAHPALLSNGQHHDSGKQSSNEDTAKQSEPPQLISGLSQQQGVVLTSAYSTVGNKAIAALYGGGQTLIQGTQPLTLAQQPQTQPLFLLGANGGIPVLARQPGLVLVNPQSNVTSQIVNLAASTPTVAMAGTPSYILLSQPSVGLPLTPDQLALLTQQSMQQAKADSTDGRSNGRSSVGSNSSMEVKEECVSSVKTRNSSEGSDSVDEHFARALGDQWQQLKHHGSQPKDIPA